MTNATSIFFIITEGISTYAYVPQIVLYVKDRSTWQSISLKSWIAWNLGCIVKFWYVFDSNDVPLLKFYLFFDVIATLNISIMGIVGRIKPVAAN